MFYSLSVIKLSNPIKDAVTVTFDVPENLKDKFNFQPGQHLIIKFIVDGQEARRSYSINSSTNADEPLQVTIKRVKGGLVSNYTNDHLNVGDVLDVMPPQGRFYANVKEDAYKTYYLFAAGSGITPMISIAKSVLHASPHSKANLFYGNAFQNTIIFKKELDSLEARFPERFNVVHTLSNESAWSSWKPWKGRKGRIEADDVEWFLKEHPPVAQTTEYYICGPGAMNTGIKAALINLDVPKELIHIEQFGGKKDEVDGSVKGIAATANLQINGVNHKVTIAENQTLLSAIKQAKIDVPYSCESGLCATCACTLKSGEVKMRANFSLEEKDIKKGLILSCQALPQTEELEISF